MLQFVPADVVRSPWRQILDLPPRLGNNVMHAKPDLRVVLKMEDRWFRLNECGR